MDTFYKTPVGAIPPRHFPGPTLMQSFETILSNSTAAVQRQLRKVAEPISVLNVAEKSHENKTVYQCCCLSPVKEGCRTQPGFKCCRKKAMKIEILSAMLLNDFDLNSHCIVICVCWFELIVNLKQVSRLNGSPSSQSEIKK